MSLVESTVVILLGVSLFGAARSPVATGMPPACPVTKPNGSRPPDQRPNPNYNGNGVLWTTLWDEGKVVFRPGGSGFALPDGSLSMKFPWWRGARGKLEIAGRRLDAPAPPLRARFPEGYGDIGFQATALIFPTPGCWEVTGQVGRNRLTFVTLVVKIGKVQQTQP